MAIIKQVIVTMILCFDFLAMGILFTLPSSTILLFSSENTTLDRIMTKSEISLMGSLSSVGSLLVIPFCGYILDKVGRKWCFVIFYFPQVIGWLLLVLFFKAEAVMCSMFLCGLSGALYQIAPVYINEYCEKSISGAMTIYIIIAFILGTFTSYLMGGLLDYATVTYLGLAISTVGLIILYFIKESPLYLMMKGREEEATRVIAFYKNCQTNSKEVIEEVGNIKKIINLDIETIETSAEEERLRPDLADQSSKAKPSVWKYLMKSRSSLRGLIILMILFATSLAQGGVVVQIFAEPLFKAAVPNISATLSSSLFAIVTIIAAIYGAYLVDRIGRRVLIIYASVLTGLCCAILGSLLYFKWGPGWLNIVFVLLYAVTYTIGPGTIPNLLVGEIFLPEIKSLATTFCTEWFFFVGFILLYSFPPLLSYIGISLIFIMFSVFSFATATFSFIYLPETKGIQVDEIQRRFLKIK